MLARLSIRDIVLIDRLDIDFASGLSVLTGETGAGKSILLDAFALALGARGDAALVRQGAEQGQVTAAFELPPGHPARALHGRQRHPGRGRADPAPRAVRRRPHPRLRQRPAGQRAGAARRSARRWSRSTASTTSARWSTWRPIAACSMPSAGSKARPTRSSGCGTARRARESEVAAHRAEVERAQREADWLRHAVEELQRLAPEPAEETALAERRAAMMQAEKVAGDLRDAHEAVAGSDLAGAGAVRRAAPAWSAARRRRRR